MASSLDGLVKNMERENLKITKREYEGKQLSCEMKPLKGENGQKITLREQIDRRKLEHILDHPDDFDLSSRTTRAKSWTRKDKLSF